MFQLVQSPIIVYTVTRSTFHLLFPLVLLILWLGHILILAHGDSYFVITDYYMYTVYGIYMVGISASKHYAAAQSQEEI